MRRALIIGNAGAGKSTFARRLAEKTSLPLVHLDQLYWRGEWEHLSREEFDAALRTELEKPKWIIDGNYNRSIPERLKYCDTVFFFDLATVTCLWGITKRSIASYGRVRTDMGGNCRERFDAQKLPLYRNVLTFNRQHRQQYYEMLAKAEHVQVIVFKSHRQAKKYLNKNTAS